MQLEYILYCDESSQNGDKYGDFFGGCLVSGADLIEIINALEKCKIEENLFGEIKWNKLNDNYLQKYIHVIDIFFDYMAQGKIKMRVMFRDIHDNPSQQYSSDEKYFKLYYQFIKHAFGFMHIPPELGHVNVRIYLDKLPDKIAKCDNFKQVLLAMPHTRDFAKSNFDIRPEDIAEIISHEHVLLQCVDIVLGCMYYRLNGLHLVKPEGQATRGKRTIAKEKLYKHIYNRISAIVPNFNIGVSTGSRGSANPHWEAPYEHWKFIPY